MYSQLPAAPSLEQLRKQAKDLLRAHRCGDAQAALRVAAHHPDPTVVPKLSAAQLVIARECGFLSWTRLSGYVKRVARGGPALQHAYHEDLDYYEGRAYGLLASAEDGTEDAVVAFVRHGERPSQQGARTVVARNHGFASWAALGRHVSRLRNSGEPFADAYRAIEARDLDGLRAQVDRCPNLVAARGTNGNDLLGIAAATGDLQLVTLLLERGADPTRPNVHGWTPLHQAAYSNHPHLARVLLDAGARANVAARGAGGTPLVVALFWGHRAVSELLAQRSLAPRNLRVAAGLGALDLVDELIRQDGRLAPQALADRAFYRPHSGFPRWRPSSDPREVLDEALLWAIVNERRDAATRLIARGARVNSNPYPTGPLVAAARLGSMAMITLLLEHGADPNRREIIHKPGATALHEAASREDADVIRALLDGGADPTI